jgi:hypothetical protein
LSLQTEIPLTKNQKELLREFYSHPYSPAILDKKARQKIWNEFKKNRVLPTLAPGSNCPALLAELDKSLNTGNLVQSAVFSECVYAQTLANMLSLGNFFNFSSSPNSVPQSIVNLIKSYHLHPRYVYKSEDGNRMLIQAGGNAGIDSALISVQDNNVFTIEFKEPGAKTSEPDLPAYGEDGNLVLDDKFLVANPQFKQMMAEQLTQGLNFWQVMGSNVNNFSLQAIQFAVSENYAAKKYADVICVEDKNGFLTMLPANQVGLWSRTEGEIRPAGRNHYKVWTPKKLKEFIQDKSGAEVDGRVVLRESKMTTATRRGGGSEVGRFKINSLFFVRSEHTEKEDGNISFELVDVRQLRPTIAAKMFFTELSVKDAHKYYAQDF